jgi:hypothetical protein
VLDEVPLPDSGGRLTGGSVVSPLGDEVGDVLAVELVMTTSVAVLLNESADVPLAVAVSSICSPIAALLPTFTVASSSSTCCSGTLPMLHLAPEASGQTLKLGEPTPVAEATRTWTATPLPAAFVLQTQTTKVARCPALTWDELEKDCTRTHSCGFLAGCDDEGEGVGVGVVELDGEGEGEGEVVGLELDVPDVFESDGEGEDDDLLVGTPDGVWLGDVLALELGSELEDELGLGPALPLSELVGEELALVSLDLVGVELALALALAVSLELAWTSVTLLGDVFFGGLPGHGETCDGAPDAGATTVAPLGTEAQAVFLIGGLAACAAIAWPNRVEERNAKPDTAPTMVGLMTTCALTRGTSLQSSLWPDRPDVP